MKSIHWELSSSTRTDGQTGTTKLIVAFRNFVKAPKKRTGVTVSPCQL